MAVSTLARRVSKVVFYILLSVIVGRTMGNPDIWMNQDFIQRLGHAIYGAGKIGADNMYDLYFYISVITVFSITTLVYIFAMKLFKKLRRK